MRSQYSKACEQMLYQTREIVKGGSTWGAHAIFDEKGARPSSFSQKETFDKYEKGIDDMRETYSSTYVVNEFEESIYTAYKYNLGNCGEFANIMAYLCIRNNVPVELYELVTETEEGTITKNGDHVFVVIGRDQKSNPANPKTWGKDALICDPWDYNYYPASEMKEHFKFNDFKIQPQEFLSNYLKKDRTIATLKQGLLEKYNIVTEKLTALTKDLQETSSKAFFKKKTIINKMISQINALITGPLSEFADTFEKCQALAKKEAKDTWLDEYSLTRKYFLLNIENINEKIKSILHNKELYSSFGFFNKPEVFMDLHRKCENTENEISYQISLPY